MNNSLNPITLSHQGFTRTQWIVSIVVVLTFLAVFVPQFSPGKKHKSTALSAKNLQQWGIGLNLYLIDNENFMPETGGPNVDAEIKKAWYNALPVYLAQKPLSEIPAAERPNPAIPSLWMDPAADDKADAGGYYFTYAMNRYLNPDPQFSTFKIYEIHDPSRTVFLVDVSQSQPGALPQNVVFRHGNKTEPMAHILFCDGHVDLVTKKEIDANLPGKSPSSTNEIAHVHWEPRPGSPIPVEY